MENGASADPFGGSPVRPKSFKDTGERVWMCKRIKYCHPLDGDGPGANRSAPGGSWTQKRLGYQELPRSEAL